MKRFNKWQRGLAILLVFCFTAFGIPSKLVAESHNLVIPKDKVISVELLDDLNSATNKNGDKVIIETREKLVIDGVVVIPYGTKGTGTIEEVHPAGHWGKGGYFKINFGSLKTINGMEIPIEIGKAAQGAQKAEGVILPVVSLVFFWPLAFFGFTKGKEAQIPKGTQMFVNTRNEVDLGITPEQAVATYGESAVSGQPAGEAAGNMETAGSESKNALKKSAEVEPESASRSKVESLPFAVTNVLICRSISKSGDPVGINSVFYQKVRSLAVWCSFENLEEDTMLESKWYRNRQLVKTKQLVIYKDKNQSFVSGNVVFSTPCRPGDWKMELTHNRQVVKTLAFKIK